jgi:hypothetical protein
MRCGGDHDQELCFVRCLGEVDICFVHSCSNVDRFHVVTGRSSSLDITSAARVVYLARDTLTSADGPESVQTNHRRARRPELATVKKKARKQREKAPSLSDWLATQQKEGRRG